MIATPNILADSDVNWPKLIFGAIFLIIWALSAFVSWINKQQQEAKRQRVRQELEGTVRRTVARMPQQMQQRIPPRIAEGLAQRFPDVLLPPAPPPPIPQQRRPVPMPRPPVQPQAPRRIAKQTRPAPLPPPPLMLEEVTESSLASPVLAPPRARAKVTVDAAALSKWMTPATLRQQFILTEILQPPLALRPDAEHP